MSLVIGSIPYRRWRLCEKISEARHRADGIGEQANDNFDNWETLTTEEKDAANRFAQRAIFELARVSIRLANEALEDLSDDANR